MQASGRFEWPEAWEQSWQAAHTPTPVPRHAPMHGEPLQVTPFLRSEGLEFGNSSGLENDFDWNNPMRVMPLGSDAKANPFQEQKRHSAQDVPVHRDKHMGGMKKLVPVLQSLAKQYGLNDDWCQETLTEIVKRMPGFESPATDPSTDRAIIWRSAKPDRPEHVEQLNRIIRSQNEDFREAQAEWSRHMEELRGDHNRELEKLRREKRQIESQARRELARLNYYLTLFGAEEALGIKREPDMSASSKDSQEVKALKQRCRSSEERVQELEQYIKERMHPTEVQPADANAVQALRQTVCALQQELKQAAAELQALRHHHQQKVTFWEQGAQRLLGYAEQFFSLNGRVGEGNFEEKATRVVVKMPSSNQDGEVESLQRMLKEALKNPKVKNSPRAQGNGELTDGKEANKEPESQPVLDGAACQVIRPTAKEEGEPADGKGDELQLAETARVAHFVAQFAVDLRKLLSASVQVPAPPPVTLPVAQSLAKQDEGEVDAIVAAATSAREKAEVKRIKEDFVPARRGAAESVAGAERALRILDRDLRNLCQRFFKESENCPGSDQEIQEEVQKKLPLDEELQRQCLMSLRQAHRCSGQALTEFLQVPTKLKLVFDLTKRLSAEVEKRCL
ncbi:unnamed protein product [Effrenium voratum]|nr:unnamed protein product [Effrenium voratum]